MKPQILTVAKKRQGDQSALRLFARKLPFRFLSFPLRGSQQIILLAFWGILISACNHPNSSKPINETKLSDGQAVVNVYTARNYEVDHQLYQEFEQKTGIKVILTKDKGDRLLQKIREQGEESKADVLICLDAGRLQYAANAGIFQVVKTEPLDENVPLVCRHPNRLWFGLGKRARVFVYNKENIKPEELDSYHGLASSKWLGQINISSSTFISNRSLLAAIIANKGDENALFWVKGIANNLAKTSKGGDFEQLNAVAKGIGNIAIVNTNAVGKFFQLKPEASRKIGVFFPNQATSGTHINFSGMGVIKNAPNKENAIKLLVFLTNKAAQTLLANQNFEYPVHPSVEPAAVMLSWGEFNADALDFNFLETNHANALELLGIASW